jgi:hypothetical protein
MIRPTLTTIAPSIGPASGGDLVRLLGFDFGPRVEVRFGKTQAEIMGLRQEGDLWVVDLRTPPHEEAVVEVLLRNLDADGNAIPGEEFLFPSAYRFVRPRLAAEADLTRVVRAVLRKLKAQVLANVSMTVSVEYDDTTIDGMGAIALSSLPSIVLSGPRVRENRFYSTNEPNESVVDGSNGPELLRRRPPYTVDLGFTITGASNRTAELFSLMAAVATFLNRSRWLDMPRDPNNPQLGAVRWEMDPEGEFQTQLDGPDDVRAFTCGFVVRGFDLDEGLPLSRGKAVSTAQVVTEVFTGGAS